MSSIPEQDLQALLRDKYAGVAPPPEALAADMARLAAGEPLAYVIGWMPFLGLSIDLSSRPLIPRPETEWWAGELIESLRARFDEHPFSFLDLCAGSGAVGLAVLKAFPNATVSFGELERAHAAGIEKSIAVNELDAARAHVHAGDLFAPFTGERFDVIAANPPYIPEERALDPSVVDYEPVVALYGGADGLSLIRRIAGEARAHLASPGELWVECDVDNIEEARALVLEGGAERAEIRTDQYGRARIVVGYYA